MSPGGCLEASSAVRVCAWELGGERPPRRAPALEGRGVRCARGPRPPSSRPPLTLIPSPVPSEGPLPPALLAPPPSGGSQAAAHPRPRGGGAGTREARWLPARVWPGVTGGLRLREKRGRLIPGICRESRERANHSSPGRDSRAVVFRWNF